MYIPEVTMLSKSVRVEEQKRLVLETLRGGEYTAFQIWGVVGGDLESLSIFLSHLVKDEVVKARYEGNERFFSAMPDSSTE